MTLPKFGTWANAISDFETPYGKLGFRQLAILWALRYNLIPEDDLSSTTLAHQQDVRPSVITRALARLEEGGFLTRTMHPHDRWRINLTLTQAGMEISIYVEKLYLDEIPGAMGELSREQIANLFAVLATFDTIAENLLSKGFGHVGASSPSHLVHDNGPGAGSL